MREILFRGKRVDNGEWVEGDFSHPSNICFETVGYDEILKQDNVAVWNDYAVDPETVGQFTSLTDKNEKNIFEYDILRVTAGKTSTICKVVFTDGRFIGLTKDNVECDFCFITDVKILGNIHDNPELMGVA